MIRLLMEQSLNTHLCTVYVSALLAAKGRNNKKILLNKLKSETVIMKRVFVKL